MRFVKRLVPILMAAVLLLSVGCGGISNGGSTPPASTSSALSPDNVNLIFVVSEDLAYQAPGDVNPSTANLTNRGLQRSLLMATFLQQHVLGTKNVTGVYVLEPMTHPQTTSNYPDMVAIETGLTSALASTSSIGFSGAAAGCCAPPSGCGVDTAIS